MKRLCGVNPPVITIFDEHHKVDIEASKRQADFLISKGVDGLAYLCLLYTSPSPRDS